VRLEAAAEASPRAERGVAWLLRAGVVAAALLLSAAQIAAWLMGVPLIAELLPAVSGGVARRAAEVGLLTLGLTPVARVVFTAGSFARRGERGQALIAVAVLALLALSLALGPDAVPGEATDAQIETR
jgi:hypothetical protein